tara:strand:- start:3301 stop:4227 length:927 start_codon:yes stop_codon:yes gene_type:complete
LNKVFNFFDKVAFFDHSSGHKEPAEGFLDFIVAWNFLHINSINGIVSLIFVSMIVIIYVTGVIRLSKTNYISRSKLILISTALFLLILVLEGPIDYYAEEMFFIHMIQHLTLMVVIAPLLLSANAMPIFIWGTPKKMRSTLSRPFAGNSTSKKILTIITRPRYSLLLYIINLYMWHIPFFYNLTLSHDTFHFINHALFVFMALLLWWPIIGPAPVRTNLTIPQKIVYVLVAVTPSAALAAFITLSGDPIYNYESTPLHWNMLSHSEDQTWGGLIMWLPGNFLFFGVLTTLFFKWSKQEEGSALPKLEE